MSFQPGNPNDEALRRLQVAREAYESLAIVLATVVPAGRHQALAATALEESALWTSKAITHDPAAQR